MRFKTRGVLVAIVAVFAMSAVVASAASAALPEFKPVPTKKKFTDVGGSLIWEDSGYQENITCTGSSLTGEITGAHAVGKAVLVATGCTGSGDSGRCSVHSVGAKAGEFVSKSLVGELGSVATSEAASGAGLRLKPETGKAWLTIAEGCLIEAVVEGAVSAEVGIVGSKQTTNKLSFKTVGGSQAIKKITLTSGTVEKPNELGFGASSMTTSESGEWKFEEALEVT